jgi:hypothetical protein
VATIPLSAFEIAKTTDGGPPTELYFPEGASQAFVAGEPVYLLNGYLVECGDNPALIVGIANGPAHNTTAGAYNVPVLLADERNIFRAQVCSAAGTRAASAVTMVGRAMALLRDTTNSLLQVLSTPLDGANGRVYCVGLSGQDVVGDTGGRVLVKFKQNNSQTGITS